MEKNKKSFYTYRDLVILALLLILLFLKSNLFYSQLHLGDFPVTFSIATCAIFILIYTLASLIVSHRVAKIIFTVLYIISCAIMAIDSVYYAYVTKLPSIALLTMAWQLDDVSSTIFNLIEPRHLAMIIDFPILLLVKANKEIIDAKFERSRFTNIYKKLGQQISRPKSITGITAIIAAVMSIVVMIWPAFEIEYMTNELLTYHVSDVIKTVRNNDYEREVDKSLYIAPSAKDSPYYGIANGRNVFVIQVEAMQNFLIGAVYEGQEIMPNLNRIIGTDTFYFDNYYYQIGGGNTSDAEFTVNNSLFAPESESGYVKYADNKYYGLPHILKDNGYSGAYAFHNYIGSFWNRETAYPYQGFDDYTSLEDMEETDMFEMGLSDREMFRQTMEQIKTYEEPFYAFYITVSSHYPYAIPLKDRGITLKEEDSGTLFGLYIQSMNYVDTVLGEFFDMLDKEGLYDNSIFVIYGDHYALTNTDSANSSRILALTGKTYSIFDVFNVPMIMHIPECGRTETISTPGGHIDVLPTLLCALGIDNDRSVMFGNNLFDAEDNIVCEQTHVSIGSFISKDVFFQKPHNNIKSNYSVYDKETLTKVDPELYESISKFASERIADCAALLARNDILIEK